MSNNRESNTIKSGGLSSAAIEIRLAASFLTIIPLASNGASSDDVARSFGWFPLIGFTLGLILAGVHYLLAFFVSGPVRAVLLILTLTAITGAVHLDGLADTADALGAGRDRLRALAILRDSRIGTFGTLAVLFVVALKIAAVASAPHSPLPALYLAPGLARWAMVAVPYKFDYLREYGAGSAILGIHSERNLTLASIVTLVALLPAGVIPATRGIAIAIVTTLIFRGFYARWLGGITGDLIGAAAEVVEAAAFVALI